MAQIQVLTALTLDATVYRPKAGKRLEIAYALWAIVVALPFLLPTHAEPWTTFYGEWLMAVAMVPMALTALCVSKQPWRFDGSTLGFALLAVVPIIQALTGLFLFPGEAVIIALYLLGFAVAAATARRVEEIAPLRAADALFAGLAIAALISTGMSLYQWLGLDGLGVMVSPALLGGRPVANVGQPNNLSTLLVWGLVAIWWGHSRGRIGGLVAVVSGGFVLLGVALTQSRTGWLTVAFLALSAMLGKRTLGTACQSKAFIGLAVWFMLAIVSMHWLGDMLLRGTPLSLSEQVAAGKRPMIWAMAIESVRSSPWWGYGWNQSVQAQLALAPEYPELHVTIAHAHNLVLDLMLWNGIPLAALAIGAFGLWGLGQLRRTTSAPQLLLLVALGVLLIHAMLELPHAYAFFLLPAAVLIGTLNAQRPTRTIAYVPRLAVALLVLVQATLLALMFLDYRQIEEALQSYRMHTAWAGIGAMPSRPSLHVLRPLQSALDMLHTQPKRGMSGDQLDRLRRTVTRYPSSGGLFRYAQAAALNGRPEDSQWALNLLCALHSSRVCQAAASDWATAATEGNHEMNRVKVPLPVAQPSQ